MAPPWKLKKDDGDGVGEDSRFFALLGSAPQELNTTRPVAKLKCWKLHARNPNIFFITPLMSRHAAARSGPRFDAPWFLLLAGYENLTAPLFALMR
jgi:hypothetical protein